MSPALFIPSVLAHDYTSVRVGTLVTRSEHYKKKRKIPKGSRFELGFVVGKKLFVDAHNGVIAFPVIHWEGKKDGEVCHPLNVRPFRSEDKAKLPMVEMEA